MSLVGSRLSWAYEDRMVYGEGKFDVLLMGCKHSVLVSLVLTCNADGARKSVRFTSFAKYIGSMRNT